MATSLELRERRARLANEMRSLVERAEAEDRDLSAEEQEQFARIDTEQEALRSRIERQERLESTPAEDTQGRIEQPETEQRTEQDTSALEQRAFAGWLRNGMAGLDQESRDYMARRQAEMTTEMRAQSVGSDTAGGFFVPDTFRQSVESAMKFYGGMRNSGAFIFSTDTGADLAIPTDDDTGNTGAILGENSQVGQQDVAIGQRVLRAYMYSSKLVLVSFQLLQDSAFPIDSWLSDKLGERIGRITNTHFTTGDGASRPNGIVTDAVSGVTAAAQAAVTFDELIDLEHSVDRAYRQRGRWMMHDLTLRELKQMKDGEGRYLWLPGATTNSPDSILGYPFTVNNDMPQMATGNKSILFGDFSKFYIRDVRGLTLLRLTERYADSLQVGFLAFSRHDAKLIDAGQNPVKCITQA